MIYGTFISPDWSPTEEDRWYASQKGYSPAQINEIVEHFRDYWLSRGDDAAIKRDWSAAWRLWVRRCPMKPGTQDNVMSVEEFRVKMREYEKKKGWR